jgi:hypothetical protein
MRLATAVIALSFLQPTAADAATKASPDCSGKDRWPASSAYGALKNAGMAGPTDVAFDQTAVRRLSSEKIGTDLYRQVHLVTFFKKAGAAIQVITVSDASHAECSMGNVQVFVISRQLGDAPDRKPPSIAPSVMSRAAPR